MNFKLTWFGHAALELETQGLHILVDPFISGNPAATIKAADLKPEFILITHGHGDHIGDTVEIAKRSQSLVISNFEIAQWLSAKGVKTHAQSTGGGFNHPFGYLKLTQAVHGSMLPDGSDGGFPAGLLITLKDGRKVYLAGDTGLFGDMRLIGEEGIFLAVIPIGDNYTMGPADALRAVQFLKPQHVIPIHYDTFPLIHQDAAAWAKSVASQTGSKVHLLQPGQSIDF
jgi:L-ascorbate metabolism protein UlaG (beta-lactamase superfamily)